MITFTIPGKPVPKARARVMRAGWSYTPKKTVQAEALIRVIALASLKANRNQILGPLNTGRVFVSMIFFGARQNADLDNLFKLVTDACQGVFYKNDCQIDHAEIVRQSCAKGKEKTVVIMDAMHLEEIYD